jgi:hypothetical protein
MWRKQGERRKEVVRRTTKWGRQRVRHAWVTGSERSRTKLRQVKCETNSSCRVLQKLTVTQLIKNFPAPYEIQGFIHHVHQSPSLVPILSHFDPVHSLTPYFFKTCNIILPSTNIRSFRLNFICTSHIPHACYMYNSSYSTWSEHRNYKWWKVQNYEVFRCLILLIFLLLLLS